MDHRQTTEQYYSLWAGKDISAAKGVEYVYSDERNRVQPGYSHRFDVWAWFGDGKTIISYGDAAAPRLGTLTERLGASPVPSELSRALAEVYSGSVSHGIKYLFAGGSYKPGPARILRREDYGLYEDFFRKINPDCGSIGWLREYFDEMADAGICCGVFADGILACCTDAPLMPYMADAVQEIGVNTLEEHRGRGYASDSARLCALQIVKNGKTPLWSTDAENTASRKTALAAGFLTYGEYIGLSLED